MISSSVIRAALAKTIAGAKTSAGAAYFPKVVTMRQADLDRAMETLRHPAAATCVILDGEDQFTHLIDEDDNTPIRSEIRCMATLLVSAPDLSRGSTPTSLADLKDALLEELMWSDCGGKGVVVYPQTATPLTLEYPDAASREGYRIELEIRAII